MDLKIHLKTYIIMEPFSTFSSIIGNNVSRLRFLTTTKNESSDGED